jgi:DNA-binding SARP family transcriptional activator/tetratricopeptide (TPR) repeat protein
MASLEITLFGEPALAYDGEPWPLRAPRVTWSLVALLVASPRPLDRAALGCLLWPDKEDATSRATLRRYLHRLTSALPPAVQWIVGDAKTLQWNRLADCRVDVLEFERAIAENRLEDAVALYRGDLLGVAFDEAILEERERLRTAYLGALEQLAGRARAERRFGDAVRYAELLLAADEWREDALRALMSARYQDGDRSGALLAYDRFARALYQELHVAPMPETTALRDAILAGVVLAEELAPEERAGDASLPFVGRDVELRALQNAWARAARGRGSTAFLSGEAGIGKSRLAHELGAIVEAQGGRVLHGRTSSPEAGAFEAIVEALREGLPLLERGHLEDVWWSALAPVVPEIALLHAVPEAGKLDSEPARLRLREAFARLIAAMAARKPLAIVLEDLHWAEAETIELLETLLRRTAGAPVFFVLTMRSEEVPARHPLEAMRRGLQRERRGQTIALGRLREQDVRELAGRLLTTELATEEACGRIVGTAGGHPLFAVQLLRYYLDTGDVPAEREPLATIGEAVLRRIERLSEDARTVAGIAATIEGAFTVEELARVSGWEESRVFDAVGALLDAKLVGERGGERFSYGFTHALIEGAVREHFASVDKRARHRRIAAVLEETRGRSGVAAALIATHWQAAGEMRRAASSRLIAARAAMERFARQEAIAQARLALELGLEDAERFAALALILKATQELGEFSAGFPELEAMEELAPRLGQQEQFETLWLRVRAFKHRPSDAHRDASERLAEFAASTGRADWIAEADFVRGSSLAARGRFEDAETMLRGVLDYARRTGNAELTFRSLGPFVQIVKRRGNVEEALRELQWLECEYERTGDKRALHPIMQGYLEFAFSSEFLDAEMTRKAREYTALLAEEGGELQPQLSARIDLAYGAQTAWDVAVARSELLECRRIAQELGLTQLQAVAAANLGGFEADVGHYGRALEHLKECFAISKRIDYAPLSCAASISAADANLAAGRADAAAREARRALEIAGGFGQPRFVAGAEAALGAVECAAGDLASGLQRLRRSLEIQRKLDSPRTLAHDLAAFLDALLDANELDEARTAAAELARLFAANPNRQRSPGKIARALIREAKGRGDEAEVVRLQHLGRRAVGYVVSRLSDPEDRAAFSAIPVNRELLDLA